MRDDSATGGLTRRDALLGMCALACAPLLDPLAALAAPDDGSARGPVSAPTPTARAVIEVWLWGGPSHLDTFDPKPEAGAAYCGPLDRAIPTSVDGIRVGSLLPLLAAQADRYALIRSMTHERNGHETAAYVTQTGREEESRLVYPSLGAVVAMLKGYGHGYEGVIPPFVVLTQSPGRFSETGFLGPRFRPFVTGGDPARPRFAVEGLVAEGITDQRQRDRRELLHELDTLGRALRDSPEFERLDRCEEQAYDLILGDAGKVFDLGLESDEVRDRYGRNTFGQSCLAARRLVESGVPYVKINSPGWDTHKQHFEIMRRKLPELDRGLSTLLADLAERGLLDSTVVWCAGEFGRTPKVQWQAPWNGGRGHYGACFSALVAGGGFRGGRVVGATDATGEHVAERAVHPRELHGAIYERMGIDPDGGLPNPAGVDARITEGGQDGSAAPRLRELV